MNMFGAMMSIDVFNRVVLDFPWGWIEVHSFAQISGFSARDLSSVYFQLTDGDANSSRVEFLWTPEHIIGHLFQPRYSGPLSDSALLSNQCRILCFCLIQCRIKPPLFSRLSFGLIWPDWRVPLLPTNTAINILLCARRLHHFSRLPWLLL